MNVKRFIILLCVATIGSSCEKEEFTLLNGHYSGSYYYGGPNSIKPEKSVNQVSLTLNQGHTYQSSGFQDKKPAGGSGEYKVLKNNSIEFTDKNAWTAEFDWNLILNGRFTYETKGDSLILTRYMEPCPKCITLPSFYQYRLKRID